MLKRCNKFLSLLLTFAMVLTLVPAAAFAAEEGVLPPDAPGDTEVSAPAEDAAALPVKDGDQVVIYSASAKGVLGEETADSRGNRVIAPVSAVLAGGEVTAEAGARVFTVEISGEYCRFKTANDGYLSATGTGNTAFYQKDVADCVDWTLRENGDGYILVSRDAKYNGGEQALEYYERDGVGIFTTFGTKTTEIYTFSFYPCANDAAEIVGGVVTESSGGDTPDGAVLKDGDNVVIYNPAHGKALSSVFDGNYSSGVDVTVSADGTVSGFTKAEVWTVGVAEEDGQTVYTFSTQDGKKLSMGEKYSSTPLDDVNDKWLVVPGTDDCVYIENIGRTDNRLEWYADKNYWSCYYRDTTGELFAQKFFLVTDIDKVPDEGGGETPELPEGAPADGDVVVIYNPNGVVLGSQSENLDINPAEAVLEDGAVKAGNGGRVFTVEIVDGYFRFKTANDGYLSSNGTGNNAFYQKDVAPCVDWTLRPYNDGFMLVSREAKYNGMYEQALEYFGGAFKTYSTNKITDQSMYTFSFCPCANDASDIVDGVVNAPAVTFPALLDANLNQEYTFSFTVEAVFGVEAVTVTVNGAEQTAAGSDGKYSVTVPASAVTGGKLEIVVSGTDTKGVAFTGGTSVAVSDQPLILTVSPESGAATGSVKNPKIEVTFANGGEAPVVKLTLMQSSTMVLDAVQMILDSTKTSASYQAPALTDGRYTATVTIANGGKTATKSWSFSVGEATERLYFGQLHSHTSYSDGSGTLDDALNYIASLPESANVQFTAFTDHSNYFDTTAEANPEQAMYDMSLASAYSQERWKEYKDQGDIFNEKYSGELVALVGFEMTWSGGPGHINTFNTPGIVSRNNTTLNNKTADAGMKAYYDLLKQAEGVDALSQFNHPGSTFGTFSDFSYWDPVLDSRMYMVEVGNGEGAIGQGGYYPSYQYYIMALDKGWHLAPTNNQDNHKGKWGNANDARDVILTDNFTEEGIYDALREMKMYATEDKNLELYYTLNGKPLGTIIPAEEIPDQLEISVDVRDPDATDTIAKVEVVVNSGRVAYTWDDPAELASGNLTCTLDPDYTYYFIRVTEGDGDLAVTAPVWVGDTLKLGISAVECGTSTPVTGEELKLTTTVFNSEENPATVKSITYTTADGEVIAADTTPHSVPSLGIESYDIKYTPTKAKIMDITSKVVMELDGKEYEYTMAVQLDVLNADELVYIGIDASHYNEYVSGNYKDSMGNFGILAAGFSARTNELYTSADLIAACSNPKYKMMILTAPSRRLEAAQEAMLVYTAEEIAALKAFNEAGGIVVLAGWSDYYENYDVIKDNPDAVHMAATQNALLEALGSSLRIADDATHDDSLNGGQTQRLYFSTYNWDSPLMKGVEFDADHPNDVMYSQRYSQYGGASIYAIDAAGAPAATLPSNVTPVVYGHATTYSKDSDGDGLGGENVPKYAYTAGDDRLLVLATEEIDGQGLIVVSGAAFMSNFEVQYTVSDSNAELGYSNFDICENLVQLVSSTKITPIAEVQAQTESGYKYTIEGVVTSNASGYDKDTAFFDCIYVQDSTAGICCFPVAGEYKIGDTVRITGYTDSYQGEMELQVLTIEKTGETSAPAPEAVTAAQINSGAILGKLVTLKGTVESFELENGLVQTIMVKDAAGGTARVFIDGYITTAQDVKDLKVGCNISATGLASYDNTFNAPDGPFPRIRVRDRADIVCTAGADVPVTPDVPSQPWNPGYPSYPSNPGGGSSKPTTPTTPTAPTETPTEPDTPSTPETPTTPGNTPLIPTTPMSPATPGIGAETFTDVTADSWFASAVDFVYTNNLMTGSSADTFAPNGTTTRAMVWTVLGRIAGADVSGTGSAWYAKAQSWATANNISDGSNPNSSITRQELVTMLWRTMGSPTAQVSLGQFSDSAAVASWASDAVQWGVSVGLLQGSNGRLNPSGNATRAELATILQRFCESVIK